MKITAVIPVKIFSDRCSGKNIRLLNGVPAIEWVVAALNKVDEIDETIVYCSDPMIEGFITSPHRFVQRCECLDTNDKNFHDIFKYLTEVDNIHSDLWVLHHATSPFVRPETIREMLKMVTLHDFDSAFLTYKLQKYMWMLGKPFGWTRNDIGSTQLIEPMYVEASGPYIFPEQLFRDRNRRTGRFPYMKVSSIFEAWDIDTEDDFKMAKLIAKGEFW